MTPNSTGLVAIYERLNISVGAKICLNLKNRKNLPPLPIQKKTEPVHMVLRAIEGYEIHGSSRKFFKDRTGPSRLGLLGCVISCINHTGITFHGTLKGMD